MNRISIYTQVDEFFKTLLEPTFNELAEKILSEMKKSFKDMGDIDAIEAWKDRISSKLKDEADVFIDIIEDYFKDLKDFEKGEEDLDELPLPEGDEGEGEKASEEEGEALNLLGDETGEIAPEVPEDLELELGGGEEEAIEPTKKEEEEKEKPEEEKEEEEKEEGAK